MSAPRFANKFHVAVHGDVVYLPKLDGSLSIDDAINLAAWIMALTDADAVEFLANQIQEDLGEQATG